MLRQEKLVALTESMVLLKDVTWGSRKHMRKLAAHRWSCQELVLLTVISYSHHPVFPRLNVLLFFCVLIIIGA